MLALMLLRDISMLEDEFERLRLDVWFVVMLAFTWFSELSMLDEELERLKLDV
jgi:hypothetical protein